MFRRAKLVGPAALLAACLLACQAQASFPQRWADAGTCRASVPAGLGGLCDNRTVMPVTAEVDPDATTFATPVGRWRCDAPAGDRVAACPDVAAPLWAVEPVEPPRFGRRAVLLRARSLGGSSADDDVAAALEAVRASGLPDTGDGVVVEYPSSPRTFAAATRGTADASTGAVTIRRDGVVAVVVNPAHARLAPDARAFLLAHELTHATAGTATWQGPRWLAEGWAESVAAPLSPTAVAASDAALRTRLAQGLPEALPGDDAFDSGGGEAPYAMARLAVAALVSRLGRDGALAWTADVAAGRRPGVDLETVTRWWREALAAAT